MRFLKLLIYTYEKIILIFRRYKNREKKKIIIYTDSRGFNLENKLYKSSLRNTYIWEISKNYQIELKICPEKHTTFLDFLKFIAPKKLTEGEIILLHIGVVDFSPRKKSQRESILEQKRDFIISYFKKNYEIIFNNKDLDHFYEGEITSSILNKESISLINKELRKIKNLVWINSNPILSHWDGNYWKKRPSNMNEVLKLQDLINIPNTIDISSLEEINIKKYTIDNIHFNTEGMVWLYDKIEHAISNI